MTAGSIVIMSLKRDAPLSSLIVISMAWRGHFVVEEVVDVLELIFFFFPHIIIIFPEKFVQWMNGKERERERESRFDWRSDFFCTDFV